MFDNNLEKKITFLKGKLPDYLRAKGLNPASKFYCINPQDHSKLPSMSYDPNTQTVRCFNCKASYNIFDLIGFQYNLSSFKDQFIKAHELFLGPVNESVLIALNNYLQKPQFEFADEFEVQNDRSYVETYNSAPFKNPLFTKLQKHGKIPSPRDISFNSSIPEQNMIFNRDRFSSTPVQRINGFNNHSSLFNSLNKEDFRPDFSEYISISSKINVQARMEAEDFVMYMALNQSKYLTKEEREDRLPLNKEALKRFSETWTINLASSLEKDDGRVQFENYLDTCVLDN